jgi:GrpB-like predicted nucleotidyltransferase (UPF0157 family)
MTDRNRALEPTTDDELAEIMIGGPTLLNGQITLSDYDPQWPALFEAERVKIISAIGDTALLIEHVGSTSVPGLCAKPIIDILLVVPDSADESAYVPQIEAAGYALRIREPEWEKHRLFRGTDPALNLHVFSPGSKEIARMQLMRDWMRAHPEDRDLYASTKRLLAAQEWKYVQNYADAKTTVIEEIMARAQAANANA